MKLDGKIIADHILETLRPKVIDFKKQGIIPTLAVILVGNDSGSLSYIKQKQKAAEGIGAKLVFEQLPESISQETLASTIAHYNNDEAVHGLILQRPLPSALSGGVALLTIHPSKDIDGFIPNSPHQVPVARAVITILMTMHNKLRTAKLVRDDFLPWLKSQTIAVVGRGETAGRPIARTLADYDCTLFVIHSETPDPDSILRNASIIISCAGGARVIHKSNCTRGVILISVGLARGPDGLLRGDYEEDEIKDIASFYTPTPGGVGPVNVACLMQNLVDACLLTTQ